MNWTDNSIPFLNLLVNEKDGCFSFPRTEALPPTHTHTHRNSYFHTLSHNHPAELKSVVKIVTHRALHLQDEKHKNEVLDAMNETLFFYTNRPAVDHGRDYHFLFFSCQKAVSYTHLDVYKRQGRKP